VERHPRGDVVASGAWSTALLTRIDFCRFPLPAGRPSHHACAWWTAPHCIPVLFAIARYSSRFFMTRYCTTWVDWSVPWCALLRIRTRATP